MIILSIINGSPIGAPIIVFVRTIPMMKHTSAPKSHEVLMG